MRSQGTQHQESLLNRPVLLINVPELTIVPHKTLPPLSLQVLRHSLMSIGIHVHCVDLAPYGPRIAECLSTSEFSEAFRQLEVAEPQSKSYAPSSKEPLETLSAIKKSGLVTRLGDLLFNLDPLMVGLSISGTPLSSDLFTIAICTVIAKTVKEFGLDIPVVIGGARIMEKVNIRHQLLAKPEIDYLVRGNGYHSIRELALGFSNHNLNQTTVPGLVYRCQDGLGTNPSEPPWGHLAVPIWLDQDAIRFYKRPLSDLATQARHICALPQQRRVDICAVPFQFTVGCINKCAFCNRASGPGRISQPEEVVDYIEASLKEYGIQDFLFLNSEINFGPRYVFRFCSELIRRKLDINWIDSCEFRGLDTSALEIMRESGCVALWFGLETASDHALQYINKRTTVEHATAMLIESNRLGIYNCLNIICGLPYETQEDIAANISYLVEHRAIIDAVQINVFYLQGGPFSDEPHRFGLKLRGYNEQVGETVSKAFDEVNSGLMWESKKQEMLISYMRVSEIADQLFPSDSRNMPLVLGLYRLFAGSKFEVRRAFHTINDKQLGNFVECPLTLVKLNQNSFLIGPGRDSVLLVNEVVAHLYQLRHLKVWSHILRKARETYGAEMVDAAAQSIMDWERKGYFTGDKK